MLSRTRPHDFCVKHWWQEKTHPVGDSLQVAINCNTCLASRLYQGCRCTAFIGCATLLITKSYRFEWKKRESFVILVSFINIGKKRLSTKPSGLHTAFLWINRLSVQGCILYLIVITYRSRFGQTDNQLYFDVRRQAKYSIRVKWSLP